MHGISRLNIVILGVWNTLYIIEVILHISESSEQNPIN